MRRQITLMLFALFLLAPSGCAGSESPNASPVREGASPRTLRATVDGGEIVVELADHAAAEALYDLLPLELTFADYNHTEKIAYLEEALPTEGAPDRCDPKEGDLCYYIPWGNLCFFYRDFRHSESLVPLGTVVSGVEWLAQLDAQSVVTLEPVDPAA